MRKCITCNLSMGEGSAEAQRICTPCIIDLGPHCLICYGPVDQPDEWRCEDCADNPTLSRLRYEAFAEQEPYTLMYCALIERTT